MILRYALQIVRVVGDNQRVAVLVGRDGVVRCDQRAQDRQELHGRLVFERKYSCLDPVPGPACGFAWTNCRARMELGVGLRKNTDNAAIFHCRKTLQAQSRKKHVIDQGSLHRLCGNDGNRPLYPRVDHEVLARDLGHYLYYAFNVRVDKIQGHDIGFDAACCLFRQWRCRLFGNRRCDLRGLCGLCGLRCGLARSTRILRGGSVRGPALADKGKQGQPKRSAQ